MSTADRAAAGHATDDDGALKPVSIAVAVLVRDGHVLLGHRAPSREWYPDCWDLIGGHVERGETPTDAIVRECAEELGVRVRSLRRVPSVGGPPGLDMHVFAVERWQGEPVNAAPDEHDQVRWFRLADVAGLALAYRGLPDTVRAAVDSLDSTSWSDLAVADEGDPGQPATW